MLNPDYQEVIKHSQDKHNIKITPLLELKGGQTGARLFLVSVSELNSRKISHLILKLDHKSAKSRKDELERHRIALDEAPSEFALNHIPEISFNRNESGNTVAIFYDIAGQSLHNYKPLASYLPQDKIEKIFRKANEVLLIKWNSKPGFQQAVHPQKVLSDWLGYRIEQGGNIEKFLVDTCRVPGETQGFLIMGNLFPNPLLYARDSKIWGNVRAIDILAGFQHGDLNIGNILVRFNESSDDLEGLYLIDFALFKSNMPLFYDLQYLQMSYLIREFNRVGFSVWIELVTLFSGRDIIEANKVPIELTGACSVINAGREEFGSWINKFHSSLSDDLWGQYWLAAVAAGLNYCNKKVISDTERLAGLIFAAVHLKRYHHIFGIDLPLEVKNISLGPGKDQALQTGSSQKLFPAEKVIKLPAQSTVLIGRENEIGQIKELFQQKDLRILTLTGPGGTGKTRLAIHIASLLSERFRDGVYFVDLSSAREPESLLSTLARTVGLKETSDQPLLEDISRELQNENLLLLLDNFEQLISATGLIVEILGRCLELKIIITSREALRIRGEQVFPVSPLSMPDIDSDNLSYQEAIQFESVKLFQERAMEVNPGFEITDENAPMVASICARLDGLPLAIELAVGRIGFFSPEELLERLDDSLKLLRGGARDLPLRHQTLQNTLDWSYDLLTSSERYLFAMFSVFHSASIEEVETVSDGIKQFDEIQNWIVDVLNSLTDKNLIRITGDDKVKRRLQMLETVKEYASDRLTEDPDFEKTVRLNHAKYYADFSKQQWKYLTGNKREEALSDFELNIENVQLAWKYWVTEKDFGQLQKLTDSLWLLFHARGWFSAIVELTADLLQVLGSTPSTQERSMQEIMLQTSLGRVMMAIKGCTSEVEEIYNNALDLCEKYGEIPNSFPILRALASFYAYLGQMDKCLYFGNQIKVLAEKLDNTHMKVEGNLILGFSTAFSGDLVKGLEILEEGINISDPDPGGSISFRFGNDPGLICHTTSAICSWMLGYNKRSIKHTERALELSDKLHHPSSNIYVLFHSGLLHYYKGEYELALMYSEKALVISEKLQFQIWRAVVSCLHGASLAGVGQIEKGFAEFNLGMEMYAELKTPPIFWPLLLLIKAGLFMHANKPEDAREIIDEAMLILEQDSKNPVLSELYRVKADILYRISPENFKQVESLLEKALEIAGIHRTAVYELRAAISLSRIWIGKMKVEQSRQILTRALDNFTDGFDTLEIKTATTILEQIK